MLYWIPAFEILITGEELGKAITQGHLEEGEWSEVTEDDWNELIDNQMTMGRCKSHILNEEDSNRPYLSFESSDDTDKHMALSWLTGNLEPGSYGYRRNVLLDEIGKIERNLEEKEYHLGQFYRILGHTVLDEEENGKYLVRPIDRNFAEMIRNREKVVTLLIRYLKDLYKAMYEEIEESLSIRKYTS